MRRRPLAWSIVAVGGLAFSIALADASLASSSAPPTRRAGNGGNGSNAATSAEFPADWFWDIKGSSARFAPMLGKAPPKLSAKDWIGEPQDIPALKGRVVVVEFWATWCHTCVETLPIIKRLADTRGQDGVVVIGVHDANSGAERMPQAVKDKGITWPTCVDADGASTKAWQVTFWPTIAVIDRAGTLRAIGVHPAHLDEIVAKLAAEPAPGAKSAAPPAASEDAKPAAPDIAKPVTPAPPAPPPPAPIALSSFTEGGAIRFAELKALDGATPPAFESPEWINSAPLKLADLKGKVVVLDFWATWCAPCLRSVPHNNALREKYKDRVVFIGLCHPRGVEQMANKVKETGILYPVCRLTDEKTLEAYQVNSYPDYFVIDREGKLRVLDCANDRLEEAIEEMLK